MLAQQHPELLGQLRLTDPLEPTYPNLSLFINFRRDDSEDVCGRIYDALITEFGRGSVFRYIDDMPDGMDIREVLEREIVASSLVLALMGPKWDNSRNLKRMNDDAQVDYVRLEIEAAFKYGIPVIPVWVSRRDQMPDEDKLPAVMRPLVYRPARAVRPDPDFHRDMALLSERIKQMLSLR